MLVVVLLKACEGFSSHVCFLGFVWAPPKLRYFLWESESENNADVSEGQGVVLVGWVPKQPITFNLHERKQPGWASFLVLSNTQSGLKGDQQAAGRFASPRVWLKIKLEGQTTGFGPCFHLPIGFHFGTICLFLLGGLSLAKWKLWPG